MQSFIIFVLFICALAYVARLIWQSLTTKKGCASNCGKCNVDFKIPQKQAK